MDNKIINNKKSKYAVFWSGGKDCFLSMILYLERLGISKDELILITFVGNPLNVGENYNISLQDIVLLNSHSNHFKCEHIFVLMTSGCYVTAYNSVFKYLHTNYELKGCVKGDIFTNPDDLLCNNSNKDDCSACVIRCTAYSNLNIEVVYPLTGLYSEDLLKLIEAKDLKAYIVQVAAKRHINLLNKKLELNLFKESSLYPSNDFDLLGEKGNYHTYVYNYEGIEFESSPKIHLDFNTDLWFQIPKNFDFISQENYYKLKIVPTTHAYIFHKLILS